MLYEMALILILKQKGISANVLLDIQKLSITVDNASGVKSILKDVSFTVARCGITALVGGSGSGKTTTGLAILRLLSPALKIVTGKIFFNQINLLALPEGAMRTFRGGAISMVFQEPLNAFNPVFTISNQIEEVLQFHAEMSSRQRRQKVEDLLRQVEIDDPRRVAGAYPHQLSGGMRQRAMIAMGIAAGPKLIIADEPTSNLDVTVQARILALFQKLQAEQNLSILLITHDLGVVRHIANDIVVMHEGQVVEAGSTEDVLSRPSHPYTQKLLEVLTPCS
jgi:ABC-type dipeptide/oligopeptide/nickel transport system ATPase component